MELVLFFISLAIIVIFTTYHVAKIFLKLLAWILIKTVFKNAQKREEEERMKNVQFLRNMGIEVLSDHDYPKNYTSIR